VNDVVDALKAVANRSLSVSLPTWLIDAAEVPPAAEMVACANGLLRLPTRELGDATPAFFSLNALDFAFDPDALEPKEWFAFLRSLWRDDLEAIQVLQEWFGYCLMPDTRLHKILLIVGPKRSGKGTIGRILADLLGRANVCGPTLASFQQNFGLAPLIGKQLAIIADARLSGKADHQVIVERLLTISGEDCLTIDRKNREHWTGRLATRLMILTNELPCVADAGGAFPSRFIVLTLSQSFSEKEDIGLTDRLRTELPGILNWAIAGWLSLQARGWFLQPASSAEAIQDLEDLSSPISAFLRERCEIRAGLTVNCALLFSYWTVWCEDLGRDHPGSASTFGRDLRTAIPGVKVIQPRTWDGGRERQYEGVGLAADIPTDARVRAEAVLEARSQRTRK
jgi:putative DNA primase/helicase